jgi:hypothetical protein
MRSTGNRPSRKRFNIDVEHSSMANVRSAPINNPEHYYRKAESSPQVLKILDSAKEKTNDIGGPIRNITGLANLDTGEQGARVEFTWKLYPPRRFIRIDGTHILGTKLLLQTFFILNQQETEAYLIRHI